MARGEGIASLHGLGPVTTKRLAEIGIHTVDQLRSVGAVPAFLRLKHRFGKEVTVSFLYGLDSAVRDVHWRTIDDTRKAELRQEARL